jgi:TPR repeat protein
MSSSARVALLVLLMLGFARLVAAESGELVALRAKAERGNALAQYNLGLVYVQGRLTPADPAEAFAWLTLASESGATGKALDSLLGTISDAQLAEGRRRLGNYRTALAARSSAAATHGTPKLASRGFTIEPVPPPPPASTEAPAPVAKAPEAVVTPISTSPAEGNSLSELTQARKELENARADLQAANAELATLRASVARLEAAAAEAKATETRLSAELAAAQQQLSTSKPITSFAPAEKPKAEEPTPPRS